ncbi:uncharacterized protein LOC142351780 isoform X2 [Convolutriloba macropyga]|uniref:uncharacterized protein LOC142351780 isoform X2 n=1 Tax=Convolutriloba macropyga TaxID=536237 RepID=UPI003F51C54A
MTQMPNFAINVFVQFSTMCSLLLMMVQLSHPISDQTLVPDASGCEVAKAALDRVKSSGIFKTDDKFLLVRAAYTSKFGKKVVISGTKGIWHLPKASLKKAQDISAKLNYVDKIRNILCVDFEKASFEDYRKPLYSVVAAALLIEQEGKNVPLRSQQKEQLSMWKKDSLVSNEIDKLWSSAIKILDENNGEDDTQCFVCVEPPTDVCIAIDESTSITPATGIGCAVRRMSELFKEDVSERLYDPSIRKVFFITTDGQASTCESDLSPYQNIPVTTFAIGSKKESDWPTLEALASKPEYARRYDTFEQFQAELPSLLYDTCKVGQHVSPTGRTPNGTTGLSSDTKISFDIAGMMSGDVRYFKFNISEGSTATLKVTPIKIDLKLFASFSNLYPSEVSYDFKSECNAGTQCSLVVKHPAQFTNAVCVNKAHRGLKSIPLQ